MKAALAVGPAQAPRPTVDRRRRRGPSHAPGRETAGSSSSGDPFPRSAGDVRRRNASSDEDPFSWRQSSDEEYVIARLGVGS